MAKTDWFQLWGDYRSMIEDTMVRNIQSDILAGYDPHHGTLAREYRELRAWKRETRRILDDFRTMTESAVMKWCHADLRARGVID